MNKTYLLENVSVLDFCAKWIFFSTEFFFSKIKSMRIFQPLNRLVISRNMLLILLSKIEFILNLVKHASDFFKFYGLQICAYFSLALVVVELLAILWFFAKQKLQNLSGTHAATLWQKLTANLQLLNRFKNLFKLPESNQSVCYKF